MPSPLRCARAAALIDPLSVESLARPARRPMRGRPAALKLPSELEMRLDAAIKLHQLAPPQTEFRFARGIGREWRFDRAWPDRMVAVECEGGLHTNGRHVRAAGYEEDCRKYSEAAIMGWTVLRFTLAMLKSGEAMAMLLRALQREGER